MAEADDYPSLRTVDIEPTEAHRAAFAVQHEMEDTRRRVKGITARQVLMETYSKREVFSLETRLFGKIVLDVTSIKRRLANGQLRLSMFRADLNQNWIDYTVRFNGCEEPHVAALKPEQLERPAILVVFTMEGGNHQTFVDGNHRMVRRWRDGLRTIDFALVHAFDIKAHIGIPGSEIELFKNAERYGVL